MKQSRCIKRGHIIACIICRYNCIQVILEWSMVVAKAVTATASLKKTSAGRFTHTYIHTCMHERSYVCRILTTTRKELRGTQLQTRRYTNKRTCLHTFKRFFLLSPPSYPQAFSHPRILTTHTENTKEFEMFLN